ncbi:MAG: sensor histidine kinase [Actinomycetota bacterium]
MTYLRLLGVAFGLVVVPLTPHWPNSATRAAVWGLIAALATGTAAIWWSLGRARSDSVRARIGLVAFGLDCLIIGGLVWAFAYERPYVTWAVLLLLPLEGALRYRLRGSLATAVAIAAFFALQTAHRADLVGGGFDLPTYVFVSGLAAMVAGIAGVMAESWSAQSRALGLQSHKLAEADRLKDRFLAITSHEIRGPLTAVITGVETIRCRRDRLTPDQTAGLLDMISSQSQQLARMVDDLMVTSQLQAHTLALQTEPTNVGEVVAGALEAAGSKRRDHRLETFVEPLMCDIDGARVSQIVRNLVENAYKYTPEHTRVAVTLVAVPGGLLISVEDGGPGLPADKRHDLFDAFSRIEETSAGQDGVGLGLFVVSHLVSAMGGRIDLHSSSEGTTFAIFVPCAVERLGQSRLEAVERRALGALGVHAGAMKSASGA